MPTYEYECDGCGHRFELFQKMGSEPRKTCPECKKRKVRRLIGSGSAVLFKGSGFYETDYRSSHYQERANADSKASEGKSGKDAGGDKATGKDSKPKSEGSKGSSTSGSAE